MKKLLLVLVLLVPAGCIVGIAAPPFYLGVDLPATVQWELISGTSIYYTGDLGVNVFLYGGRYYKVVNGMWYASPHWHSGWRIIRTVPEVFLWIPPAHPMHRFVVYHPRYYRYHHAKPMVKYSTPAPSTPAYSSPAAPPGKVKSYKGKKGTDEREGGGKGSGTGVVGGTGGSWIRR